MQSSRSWGFYIGARHAHASGNVGCLQLGEPEVAAEDENFCSWSVGDESCFARHLLSATSQDVRADSSCTVSSSSDMPHDAMRTYVSTEVSSLVYTPMDTIAFSQLPTINSLINTLGLVHSHP